MARKALLIGATGLVGQACLDRLLSSDTYDRVQVLSRRPLERTHPKLQVTLTDFGNVDALGEALAVDDVFCALGTTIKAAGSRPAFERVDYHMVVDTARAARKAGARRLIVVSAVGASQSSPSFYSRVKARMEAAVSDAGFAAVEILRPSLLLGQRMESRPAERLGQIVAPVIGLLLIGPLKIYKPVRAEAVADAMLSLARDDAASGVRVHHLPLE